MSLRHRFAPRSIATTAALGLAASAVVLGTGTPASAASINYDCTTLIGPKTFATSITSNAPTTAAPGTSVAPTLTVKMAVPSDLSDLMRGIGTAKVTGSVAQTVLVNGTAQTLTLAIPSTPVPSSGSIELQASGPLAAFTAGAAGTVQVISAGNQTTTMNLLDAAGAPVPLAPGPVDTPCVPAAGQALTVSSVASKAPAAVKAASKTTVKVAYKAKKKTAKVTATVAAPNPAGKVTFTLKKGSKTKKVVATVVGGKAKATFKKLKKGKYTVTAAYGGSSVTKPSSATVKFKAK